jgi:hypothetical protein
MQESYEKGVANHSAPSFASCIARCTAKRKQGYRRGSSHAADGYVLGRSLWLGTGPVWAYVGFLYAASTSDTPTWKILSGVERAKAVAGHSTAVRYQAPCAVDCGIAVPHQQ